MSDETAIFPISVSFYIQSRFKLFYPACGSRHGDPVRAVVMQNNVDLRGIAKVEIVAEQTVEIAHKRGGKALFDAEAGRELSVYGCSVKLLRLAAKVLPHRVLVGICKRLLL